MRSIFRPDVETSFDRVWSANNEYLTYAAYNIYNDRFEFVCGTLYYDAFDPYGSGNEDKLKMREREREREKL